MHFDKKIVRDKKKFDILGGRKGMQIVDRTLQQKNILKFEGIQRENAISRVDFLFNLFTFYAYICRSRAASKQYSNWIGVCVMPNASQFLSLFRSFSLLHCHRCSYHPTSLIFCWCSMKKFCSSLSSFRVICLQLHKICKFSSISGDKKNIVYSWKKDGKKWHKLSIHFSRCRFQWQQIEK